jgi:hypothetical protein
VSVVKSVNCPFCDIFELRSAQRRLFLSVRFLTRIAGMNSNPALSRCGQALLANFATLVALKVIGQGWCGY